MPRKYFRRRRKTFKKSYKKRGPTNRSAGFGRGLLGDKPKELVIHRGLGIPDRFRTTLRYCYKGTINIVAGAAATYSFGLNCLYDPNLTGTGAQPMYFDQLMTLYNHYKVLGTKMNVRLLHNQGGTTAQAACHGALIVNDDTTLSPTNIVTPIEWGQLNNVAIVNGLSPADPYANLNLKWSARKYFKEKYQSDQLCGDVGSNPTEQSVGMIVVQPIDGGSTLSVSFMVIIDYIADFFEVKDVAAN